MKIDLNEKSAENLIKLKATSLLSDKELISYFNVSAYRLKKIKKDIGNNFNLSDKDWIYGALRTLSKCTIGEIAEFIDNKNRVRLPDNDINVGLEKLTNEGHAYKVKEKWNYCQRLIEVYSNKTDKFVSEVELGSFDLTLFKRKYKPKDWDYLMYEQFDISEQDLEMFKGRVSIEMNFKLYTYCLTCRKGEK